MIKIEPNQSDFQRVSQRFANLARELAPAVRRSLATDAGTIITDHIKYNLLSGRVLKVRTGRLRDSIKLLPVANGVRIYQDEGEAPYGRFHEFGVMRSWEIRPRDPNGVLHFTVGGKEIFTKRVVHPGLPERSFLRRGVQEKLGPARQALERAIQRAIRGR